MRFVIQAAASEEEVERCRALAAEVHAIPPGGEPADGWPDRWLMAVAGGRLVATIGLSGRMGCLRWFSGRTGFPLAALLRESGASDLAELRLLSVESGLRGFRFARLLFAAACSRAFLAPEGKEPAVLLEARPNVFRVLSRCFGVTAQPVEASRSGGEAPELRLLLLGRDVPERMLRTPVPAELSGLAFRRRSWHGTGRLGA